MKIPAVDLQMVGYFDSRAESAAWAWWPDKEENKQED